MAENLTSGKDAVDGIEGVEVEEEAKAVRVPYQAITKDNLDLVMVVWMQMEMLSHRWRQNQN